MDDSDQNINLLMSSDLDKKRDQALILGTRQNTKALSALSSSVFGVQKIMGHRLESLNETINKRSEEMSQSLDKLTSALKAADKSAGIVSKASVRLTVFLVIGTLVQACVAVILLFKR